MLISFQIIHQVSAAFGVVTDLRTHDDHIKVTAEHANRIELGFAFDFGRSFGVTHFVTSDAQNLASRHEGQERSRGRLSEIQHRSPVRQQLT